jgi:hypothetical protein
VWQLSFFEIARNPKRACVYQGHQLYASSDILIIAKVIAL